MTTRLPTLARRATLVLAAALPLALAAAGPAAAQEPAESAAENPLPPMESWAFSGPFGVYDTAQLQRGYQVYRQVCSNCHSAKFMSFRNLSEPGGPEFSDSQVKALAATFKVQDGPDDSGNMYERPGRPSDPFPSPFANEQAARAANGGALPPDMSTLAKARSFERGGLWFLLEPFSQYQNEGPDYIHALLNGYEEEPPEGFDLPPGKYYNHVFPGHAIGMAPPLADGQVTYVAVEGQEAVPETLEQYSTDVAAFMMWMAEPHLAGRKQTGFVVLLFLVLFAGLMYGTKRKIWAGIEH